jgi:hypothetical protein
MRKKLLAIFLGAILFPTVTWSETDAGFKISTFQGINQTSLGINGMFFPPKLSYGRYSAGFDLGLELIERHYVGRTVDFYDTVAIYAYGYPDSIIEYDYVWWFNKKYHDYLFFPLGILLRYDLNDSDNLNALKPSFILGLGCLLNIYQESGRQIQDWYDTPNQYAYRTAVDFGGETISTLDFYLKPKIALFWNRFYFSYEYYFNTRYLKSSFDFGYIFRL